MPRDDFVRRTPTAVVVEVRTATARLANEDRPKDRYSEENNGARQKSNGDLYRSIHGGTVADSRSAVTPRSTGVGRGATTRSAMGGRVERAARVNKTRPAMFR
jgi:hypothetical protein